MNDERGVHYDVRVVVLVIQLANLKNNNQFSNNQYYKKVITINVWMMNNNYL